MRRVVFELAPQLRQIDPQIVGFLGVGGAPHLLEQFLAPDQFAAVSDQHLQHAPLGGCQMYFGAVLGHPLRAEVDGERRRLDDRLVGVRRGGAAPYGRP